VLDPDELQDVARTFGVDESQVLRDHLISHLLAAISAEATDEVVFIGGNGPGPSPSPTGAFPRTSTSSPPAVVATSPGDSRQRFPTRSVANFPD
jgi:hypothetical protein